MKELLLKLLKNKKIRESIILTILLFILIIVLVVNLRKVNQKKSIKLLICKECREPETRTYVDIKTQLCSRCAKKGQMLYSYKCSKCDYEFGVKPIPKNQLEGLSKKERAEKNTYHKQCPNCNSIETYQLVDFQKMKRLLKEAQEKREAEEREKRKTATLKSELKKKKTK